MINNNLGISFTSITKKSLNKGLQCQLLDLWYQFNGDKINWDELFRRLNLSDSNIIIAEKEKNLVRFIY